jgi:hypothetical protein
VEVAERNTKSNRTMDSEEDTTDDGKRKSNQPDLKGIFGSKKMKKTTDTRNKSEDKMEIIMEMIQGPKQEVRGDLRVIKEEQKLYV